VLKEEYADSEEEDYAIAGHCLDLSQKIGIFGRGIVRFPLIFEACDD